jgi:uncharacterized protein YndB with AHSA1/START domain
MSRARKPKRERTVDDQPHHRAPHPSTAVARLRRAAHAGGIARWWGPDDGPVLLAETDLRVGGRYRVRFRMLDGTEHESSDEYLEFVRPERLAMSWRWAGGEEDPGESLVEIDLRVIAEGTELTFTHSRLHDEETRRSHEAGWNGALDKLECHFLTSSKGETQ